MSSGLSRGSGTSACGMLAKVGRSCSSRGAGWEAGGGYDTPVSIAVLGVHGSGHFAKVGHRGRDRSNGSEAADFGLQVAPMAAEGAPDGQLPVVSPPLYCAGLHAEYPGYLARGHQPFVL